MAKCLNGHVLTNVLDALAKSPLNQADDSTLVRMATAVWYSDVDLMDATQAFLAQHPNELQVRRAGYLLEKLTRFSCVSTSRASETFDALGLFRQSVTATVHPKQSPVALSKRRDELAASWGLSEGLGLKVQTLLPYQTRHYEAQQTKP